MATDGPKIIDGDRAHDTYWGIMDLYDGGADVAEITEAFPLQPRYYFDAFDLEIYVTSCGLAYWELGLMDEQRLNYIRYVISQGACVREWAKYSEEYSRKRQAVLRRFLARIEKKNQKIRKRKKYRTVTNFVFNENSVLAFKLSNGEYAAAVCVDISQYRGNCHYWLTPTTYRSIERPDLEQIKQTGMLGGVIPSGFSKAKIQQKQPGIEKIWAYRGGEQDVCFGFTVHAIAHKDLRKIKHRFEKIGEISIAEGLKDLSSLSYLSSFEEFDEAYVDLEEQIAIFRYQKYPVRILLDSTGDQVLTKSHEG